MCIRDSVLIEQIALTIYRALQAGGTLFTCGNGGSTADALHLAEELIGRYRANRRPLPALCLAADPTALTCIANDFGYEQIFSRQLAALAHPGDVLVCLSTSGASANIVNALRVGRECGVHAIALLGKDGGAARGLADQEVIIAKMCIRDRALTRCCRAAAELAAGSSSVLHRRAADRFTGALLCISGSPGLHYDSACT